MQQEQPETTSTVSQQENNAAEGQGNNVATKLVLQQGEIKNNDHDPEAGNAASSKEARNGESYSS